MDKSIKNNQYLTIGELARLTGITTHNLRMWGRRYGTPEADRLPSGHRRYTMVEANRLQMIAKALKSGYKLNKIVGETLDDLKTLLRTGVYSKNRRFDDESESIVCNWVKAVENFDECKLSQGFREVWGRQGPMSFIQNFAGPFLKQVGLCWRSGEITISQEHFATEILTNFLSINWQSLNSHKVDSVVLLATLPKENHQLGLLMCAVITALTDHRIIKLGVNIPYEEIVSTAKACKAKFLAFSISECQKSESNTGILYNLRNDLDRDIEIAIGGAGAVNGISGITYFGNFSDYYDWIANK
jgi:MerR family transcriptional regulator, light-induced transcriptional regulator